MLGNFLGATSDPLQVHPNHNTTRFWLAKYPLVSIEDPFDQDSTNEVGSDVRIAGASCNRELIDVFAFAWNGQVLWCCAVSHAAHQANFSQLPPRFHHRENSRNCFPLLGKFMFRVCSGFHNLRRGNRCAANQGATHKKGTEIATLLDNNLGTLDRGAKMALSLAA